LEVVSGKGFGEDVCSVVSRAHAGEVNGPILDELADVMKFHTDVFNVWVANVVLG
jgi:hypothetical protein